MIASVVFPLKSSGLWQIVSLNDGSGIVPLPVLDVHKLDLADCMSVGTLRELVMKLKLKVPLVKIQVSRRIS